ncbi:MULTISPECIES: cell division protein SepF [unclassified Gordonia (in: high G+C Gram-positive bacteria)]|uniref:cell division protein SepF n=1 Tax=unclassified Gordonia (in: high G+C Gram-positive bacteria) TaxID=2657482 RepID=UPI001F0FF23B|nr:cell division protein SepF [Gordonia sp. ABSL49_1]MCH5641578.1 cell division protein SepF [Gordonia sp. ABSL49_1]
MTTMQKFKAYFGMVPPSEYEDDYLDESVPPMRGSQRGYRDDYRGADDYRDDYRDDYYAGDGGYEPGYGEPLRAVGYRDADLAYVEDRRFAGGYEPEYAYAGARPTAESMDRVRPTADMRGGRLEPLQRSSNSALRSAAGSRPMSAEQRAELERVFADSPLQKITTLRPSDYSEARTIGERFRDGNPVIMDLVDMSNDDAKRLVDFAAGLAFALRGSFDKVATKVFLLSPADVDVSAEDRRKIAETGFYNHS